MDRETWLSKIFYEPLSEGSISDRVMNKCGEYIEKNTPFFILSAHEAYKLAGEELSYDYAEIKDMEEPELHLLGGAVIRWSR